MKILDSIQIIQCIIYSNHQLQLVIDSINQLVSKYSILQFWKSDDMLIKSKEEVEEYIDNENDKYSKEDGMNMKNRVLI